MLTKQRSKTKHPPLYIILNIIVGKPQYPQAALFQILRSPLVVGFPPLMTLPVEFNDELFLYAEKINDVGTKGNLPAELARMRRRTRCGVFFYRRLHARPSSGVYAGRSTELTCCI